MTSEVLPTETKFTSGTWHASATFRKEGSSPGIDIGSSNGTNLATVYYEKLDQEPREVRANARLIAAAPDLYEALQFIYERIADPERSPRDLYPALGLDAMRALDMARAALAKARSEAPHEGK